MDWTYMLACLGLITLGFCFYGIICLLRKGSSNRVLMGPRGSKVNLVPMPCGGEIDIAQWSGEEDKPIFCSKGCAHSFEEFSLAVSKGWMREERVLMPCGGLVMLAGLDESLSYATCSKGCRHSMTEVEKILSRNGKS